VALHALALRPVACMVGGAPAAGSPSSSQAADDAAAVPEEAPQRESCVRHFDALWFCYSAPPLRLVCAASACSSANVPTSVCRAAPGHQLRQYYRYGDVDDCFGHWELLWVCLKQRTRFRGQARRPRPRARWP